MTDDNAGFPWPPAMFAEQFQEASEDAMQRQQELYKQWLSMSADGTSGGLSELSALSTGTATFKSRVQSGGRISIPDAEREALDIEEGDIVQTIVVPVKRDRDSE
ncbi:hypothetical protein L593_00950 [Salinarchaeum sp. Harcht-Bsk1]|uniref:AbrB/MazE/SpoVT family DNA-binding domain-containing protein n=1 Tax=Salinarchaeum sp. Harcht-Bsk1 TaxID=1333523 RepID=UPI0003422A2A|nr:AbrB/MazE/SpoVT family DNA-binding domain-containing protein [Salinarchaeum sp. Harcht-Bsk1]AGN00145.1 hypothetical protein L593_00950 [Salinarchaeum sp. Harcht-Bsk1]